MPFGNSFYGSSLIYYYYHYYLYVKEKRSLTVSMCFRFLFSSSVPLYRLNDFDRSCHLYKLVIVCMYFKLIYENVTHVLLHILCKTALWCEIFNLFLSTYFLQSFLLCPIREFLRPTLYVVSLWLVMDFSPTKASNASKLHQRFINLLSILIQKRQNKFPVVQEEEEGQPPKLVRI